jgi:hypothetical protein
METIYIIGRLLIFVGLLMMPQLLGLLVHFRMKNHPRLAYFVGFAVTMIFSLSVLKIIFAPPMDTRMCGLGALAALVIILFFLGVQAVVSVGAQYWFYKKR